MSAVFDFDRTVTSLHTFRTAQMYGVSVLPFYSEQYLKGQQDAVTNVKQGVSDYLKHDDGEHSSAIATFHNNHSMVAGYISFILGKELTWQETYLSDNERTAIAQYTIEGIEKPFLISFINAHGSDFNPTLHALGKNKNEQLNHLRQIMHKLNPCQVETEITLYDDDMNNCEQAAMLPLTTVFHVNATIRETFVCEPWHESLKLRLLSAASASSSSSPGFFSSSSTTGSSSDSSVSRRALLDEIRKMVNENEHDKVEECITRYPVSPGIIAGFYAEAGNHERVEAYREKYNASIKVITQAYAYAHLIEKVYEYQQRFDMPDSFVASCLERAGYVVTETPCSDQPSTSSPGL